MDSTQTKKHIVNAEGRAPGRVATEVAVLLMGKNRADFAKNRIPDVSVEVNSSSKMMFNQKKLRDKFYQKYSGYPGGLKKESQSQLIKSKGSREVLRKAVFGMLPKNKLRAQMIKRLKINE